MLVRSIAPTRQRLATSFPVLAMTGPRQSGQTITSDTIRAEQRAIRMAEDEALTPWLIYGGDETHERSGVKIFGWRDFQAGIPKP
jgi:hypothetical protein